MPIFFNISNRVEMQRGIVISSVIDNKGEVDDGNVFIYSPIFDVYFDFIDDK